MKRFTPLENRKPHIRAAVVPYCNFSCKYCRPGGEGIATSEIMNAKEFIEILKIASDVGFKHIKFTGGEPLLRQKNFGDLTTIIHEIRPYFDEIQLVTNGSLLEQYAEELKYSGLDNITVSLDFGDGKKINDYVGVDAFDAIMRGLQKCKEINLPVTINCVFCKENFNELDGLIDIAHKFSAKLKLIDMMSLTNEEYWKENYISLNVIEKKLETMAVSTGWGFPPGGLGTPMPEYTLKNSLKVYLRDATIGTNYHELCKNCLNFPCQDALISLRITSDGKLKMCLIRDDNLVETLNDLHKGNIEVVKKKIKSCYERLIESKFYPFKWEPKGIEKNKKTVSDVKKLCLAYLKKLQFENPELETELLVEEIFGKARMSHILTKEEKERLEEFFNKVSMGIPIQYQVGYIKVHNNKVFITKDTLLPGPEIEYLIDACIKTLKSLKLKEPTIIDMCTGSGSIAIALGKVFHKAKIYATDVSKKALMVARKSVKENKLKNVALVQGHMFSALKRLKIESKVDLFVSNPPYVMTNNIEKLPVQIQKCAPKIALNGGKDGFKFYRTIIKNCTRYLKPGGFLVLENEVGQSRDLLKMIKSENQFDRLEIMKNHKDEERIIVARRSK